MMQIVELMRVPSAQHDLDWLERGLQAALELEFATIPPYLTAYWSIKDLGDPSATSIREVFIEEMLHFAICCNLLAAIGGVPVIASADVIPRYPGPLPGGVHPGLEVALEGLTPDVLRLFMAIEYPLDGPVAMAAEEFATIGAFYAALDAAFVALAPPMAADRQVTTGWMPALQQFTSVGAARDAIRLITVQGEGSKASPEETDGDLAHYYRFGEIERGRRLRKDPVTGTWNFDGDVVPFPDVWPVARVPAGGYTTSQVTPEVGHWLDQFDREYTVMLRALHDAWQLPSPPRLDDAIGTMFALQEPALELVKQPIPGIPQNYGPCFRFRP